MPQSAAGFANTDVLCSGHLACPGCGGILALRMAVRVLAPDCVFVIPACCMAVVDGPWPISALGAALYHTAFAATASTAAGLLNGLRSQGRSETVVVGWAGDGGTFDIGLAAVSASASRNDDMLYVCYDNEAYMNTGIQQSSATPYGAWTTTTPAGSPKNRPKKDALTLMLAHDIPYIASANPAYPEDFERKFRTAKGMHGFRFIHVFSACPPGHKSVEADSIVISRLATETGIFPLYEVANGQGRLTLDPPRRPVGDYLALQRRFAHFKEEDIVRAQEDVERGHQRLLKLLALQE
ncbi:MAG: pyruvate synthase subunit beta [Calditrichaeota bacterium]|nr:pyruvate synthase subunit beta [Calditrichota bacterium]